MESGPDWGPWLDRLAAGRRTIGAAALLAAGLAFVLGLLDRDRHEATAILALARSDAALSFDPRFPPPETDPALSFRVASLRSYPELATADAMAPAVLEALAASPEGAAIAARLDADALRRRVGAEALAEGSLIAIRARADSPEAAATIANAWARVLVERMDALFGRAAEQAAVEGARAEAAEALATRDAAVAAAHAEAGLPALELALVDLEARYARSLRLADRLATVARDIASLRGRLAEGGSAAGASGIAALALELRALASEGEGGPLALELPAGGLGVPVTAADLEALGRAVEAERSAALAEAEALPARIAEDRATIERQRNALLRVERERALAEERFVTLGRKADELAALREAAGTELRLASPALPGRGMSLGGLVLPIVLAALLGALGGALWVLLRGDRPARPGAAGDG